MERFSWVCLVSVCLVWSPGGRSLAVPPGDWSAPPPAAESPPSPPSGSRWATGAEAWLFLSGYTCPSTSLGMNRSSNKVTTTNKVLFLLFLFISMALHSLIHCRLL